MNGCVVVVGGGGGPRDMILEIPMNVYSPIILTCPGAIQYQNKIHRNENISPYN